MKHSIQLLLMALAITTYSCTENKGKSEEIAYSLIDSTFLITNNSMGEYSLGHTFAYPVTEEFGGNLRDFERWIGLDDVRFKVKGYVDYDGNEMQVKLVDYSNEFNFREYEEVNEILVRSPLYQTKEGAAVGLTLQQIKEMYNDLTCDFFCACPEPTLSIKYPEYSLSVQTAKYPNIYFIFSTKQLKKETSSYFEKNLPLSEIRDNAKVIAILLSKNDATVDDIESELRYY